MVGNFRIYMLYDFQSKITKKIFCFKIMMKPCPKNISSIIDIQTIGVRLFFDSSHFVYYIPILNPFIWIYINFMYFFLLKKLRRCFYILWNIAELYKPVLILTSIMYDVYLMFVLIKKNQQRLRKDLFVCDPF